MSLLIHTVFGENQFFVRSLQHLSKFTVAKNLPDRAWGNPNASAFCVLVVNFQKSSHLCRSRNRTWPFSKGDGEDLFSFTFATYELQLRDVLFDCFSRRKLSNLAEFQLLRCKEIGL